VIRRLLALSAFATLLASAATAQPAAPDTGVRAEVPVREVDLSDGTRRYAVPIRIGSVALDAGLDTGSTGLRVMPGVLTGSDAKVLHRAQTYSFGAGVKLEGDIAQAQLSFGALTGPGPVEVVREIGCVADQPRCAATHLPAKDFRIQGDGLTGEGFEAILGVNMGGGDAANPFAAAGARRWIVELPRPGEPGGRIILNPTDAELDGYVFAPVLPKFSELHGGLHDAIAGCIAQDSGAKARVCGALTLDSGAPGLRINHGPLHGRPWANGTAATLIFAEPSGKVVAGEAVQIGDRAQATHLDYSNTGQDRDTAIFAGLTPYFAYSVLYDPEHGRVGFKPRPPVPGGPRALMPSG
jgi:hypothetical protein